MRSYQHDTVTELVSAYRSDRDAEHDDEWWAETEYTTPSSVGLVHLQPAQPGPDGTAQGWRVYLETELGSVERRRADGTLPDPDEAAREIGALIRQATPSRHPERDRVIGQLRELAIQRHKIDMQARRVALDAVAHGVKKVVVADAARISRVTLDRWIRDR